MVEKIRIPQVSANIDEVAVTAWLQQEGALVRKGDALVELTTDKACIEHPAPCTGVLRQILAPEKSLLPVGYVIALVGGKGEPLPDVEAENKLLLDQRQNTDKRNSGAPARRKRTKRTRVRATPAARRVARELGIDLTDIAAAANEDAITEEMVRAHGEQVQR